MKLEVKEDLEAPVAQGAHDGRALAVEERHAHLDPAGPTLERLGERERPSLVAVKRDDDGVARLRLAQHSNAPISSLMSDTPCPSTQATSSPKTLSEAAGS